MRQLRFHFHTLLKLQLNCEITIISPKQLIKTLIKNNQKKQNKHKLKKKLVVSFPQSYCCFLYSPIMLSTGIKSFTTFTTTTSNKLK